jgi:hypothetical protein
VYTFSGKDLVKKRWALKEQTLNYANTLVPDYVGEPTLIIYTNEPCATPFDKTVSVNVGEKVTFADGLTLKLQKINDSRCKPDVQCIWQGELSAVFVATFPDASSSEITIGTVMKKSVTSKGYNFTLQSATEKSVSMRVSH